MYDTHKCLSVCGVSAGGGGRLLSRIRNSEGYGGPILLPHLDLTSQMYGHAPTVYQSHPLEEVCRYKTLGRRPQRLGRHPLIESHSDIVAPLGRRPLTE